MQEDKYGRTAIPSDGLRPPGGRPVTPEQELRKSGLGCASNSLRLDLLKKTTLPLLTAVALSGKVVQLVEEKAARAALVASGQLKPRNSGSGSRPAKPSAEEKAEAEAEAQFAGRVQEATAAACLEAAVELPPQRLLAALLALSADDSGGRVIADVLNLPRPKTETPADRLKAFKDLTLRDLIDLTLKTIAWRKAEGWHHWQLNDKGPFPEIFGVDVKAIEKQVRAAAKAQAKADRGEAKLEKLGLLSPAKADDEPDAAGRAKPKPKKPAKPAQPATKTPKKKGKK